MSLLQQPPPQWGPTQITRFHELMQAIQNYELFAAALARTGVNNAVLNARRDELRDHIINTLAPRFRDTPAGT